MTARILTAVATILSACLPVSAQTSTGYKLNEHALNAGGHPAQAVVAVSARFRITLDSIGGPVVGRGIAGASFHLDSGFDTAYAPPGEVRGLEFLADGQTLSWLAEPNSTAYDVYASPLATLPGDYGGCAQSRVTGSSWIDPSATAPGDGRFYLVTGENRLWEEGTKGWASGGTARGNASSCP